MNPYRAALIVLTLAFAWFALSILQAQPASSLGTFPLPLELGTNGPESYVLATGKVDSADHEAQEGYAAIAKVSLSVPPDSTPADILRQLRGREVELVIRVKEPRIRQEIRK